MPEYTLLERLRRDCYMVLVAMKIEVSRNIYSKLAWLVAPKNQRSAYYS